VLVNSSDRIRVGEELYIPGLGALISGEFWCCGTRTVEVGSTEIQVKDLRRDLLPAASANGLVMASLLPPFWR
jgi:hypothetical protein